MNKQFHYFVMVGILGLGTAACTSTQVHRVAVDRPIDLSGQWNDYDATLVSHEMIADCLDRPWLHEYVKVHQQEPVVIVGDIVNRTDEHVNVQVFVKDLEKELLNSGKVDFVASADERLGVRREREDQQQGLTDPSTIKPVGFEHGADYMLIGSLNSVRDMAKGKFAILYQVNLELIDLTTNKKVWMGQKEIKKFVEQKRFAL